VFLDDCFASDLAVQTLTPYFPGVEDFRKHFPDERKGKLNGVKDPRVIQLCHEKRWLLLTTDHEMLKTHIEEIKSNPDVTILATAHNAAGAENSSIWLCAVIKLKDEIMRRFKKRERPWFATFSSEGHISSFKTKADLDKCFCNRTRPK
jgi:hypothetical protein